MSNLKSIEGNVINKNGLRHHFTGKFAKPKTTAAPMNANLSLEALLAEPTTTTTTTTALAPKKKRTTKTRTNQYSWRRGRRIHVRCYNGRCYGSYVVYRTLLFFSIILYQARALAERLFASRTKSESVV